MHHHGILDMLHGHECVLLNYLAPCIASPVSAGLHCYNTHALHLQRFVLLVQCRYCQRRGAGLLGQAGRNGRAYATLVVSTQTSTINVYITGDEQVDAADVLSQPSPDVDFLYIGLVDAILRGNSVDSLRTFRG
jgi:hypothetical protein